MQENAKCYTNSSSGRIYSTKRTSVQPRHNDTTASSLVVSLNPTVQPAPAAQLNDWLCFEKYCMTKTKTSEFNLCRGGRDLLGFANRLAEVCIISRRHQHALLEFRWNFDLSHMLHYLACFATHSDRYQHLQRLTIANIALGKTSSTNQLILQFAVNRCSPVCVLARKRRCATTWY